jgi:hypothetical protein
MVHPWMSEWVSEWVSAGLLFAKANEELTYKHLGTRNDVQKLQVSVCLESLVMKRIMNEVCTYLYKSLGKLIVKSWSPKGMGFFNHKTEKSQDSFDSKDPMNGPQDLSKNHGWTDFYWESQHKSIPTWTLLYHTMDKFYPLSCNKPPWLMILNSDPLPGFVEREREHNCLLNNCKLNHLSVCLCFYFFLFFFGVNTVVGGQFDTKYIIFRKLEIFKKHKIYEVK